MSDTRFWFTKALYFMDHITRLAPDDGWDRASPCEGWTARHVVGHVLAIQHYFVCTIEGRAPTMNPMVAPDRHAGADPVEAWAEARDAVLHALDRPAVLDAVVATVQGEQRVDEMIAFNVADTTVHSWDLARALGVDDTLDPTLVIRSLELADAARPDMAAAGVFGTPIPTHAPDDQARLLAAFGRQP